MNDVVAQLAEANPIRTEDLAHLELSARTSHPTPRRRLIAAAVLATAVAASLIGALLVGGSPHSAKTSTTGMTEGPTGIQTMTQALHVPRGKQVTLADAAATLDAPVVLPDTALVRPEDAGPIWAWSNGNDTQGFVTVAYLAQRLVINYQRPFVGTDPLAHYTAVSREIPSSQLISLDGVPAVAIPPNPEEHSAHFRQLIFAVNGLEIEVWGNYDEPTLQAVAQSIIDRMGGPTVGAQGVVPNPEVPVTLSQASAALGAPVVLPETSRIGPSDIGSITKECPGPWGKTCAITIRFFLTWDPKGAVGPTSAYGPTGSGGPSGAGVQIRYSLGGYRDPLPEYRAEGGRSTILYLSGTPALFIPQNPRDTAGTASYMEFQLNGLTISVVERDPDGPSVQAIAQSIVDRSK